MTDIKIYDCDFRALAHMAEEDCISIADVIEELLDNHRAMQDDRK